MHTVVTTLAVIAIVAYVIGRQLLGESLRGKRVIALPAILAASGAPTLLLLGINRLGQAAVVAARALAASIPFAPEKDGSAFPGGVFGDATRPPGPPR